MKHQVFNHKVPIQIRFNDIDGQKHVNNAVYQSYFDIGRVGYLSAVRGKDYQPGGRSVVIASVQIDFLKPIFIHDSVQVESMVSKIGRKSFTLQQRITDINTGEIKANCITVFAGFDYERQQTMEITAEMKAMIKAFEKNNPM